MKKVLKYTLIVAGWIILGVIVLLLLASLLIQTRPVKNKLANVAENQAEKFINGNLSIGELDGNFFTGLVLRNVLLTYENDTVAYIAELNVSYNLWPLTKGEVEVPNVNIDEPYFYLEQYPDSTWNVQKIMKPAPEKTDTTQSGGMALSFPDIQINSGRIETSTPDTIIPQKIKNLNTQLAFHMDGNKMTADLQEFNLTTVQPDFVLNQLAFEFKQDSGYYELNNFRLKTAMNQLNGQAEFESEPPREASAHIESDALQLKEFRYFLPDLKIPAEPIVNIDAEMMMDSVHITLELKDNNQNIALNARSSNLADYLFNDSDAPLDYHLQGRLDNINLGHWMGNPEMNYTINGNLSANGRGIDPASAEVLVKADLGKSIVEDKRFEELVIDLEMFRGNLRGMVRGNGEFGEFRIEPDIQNIMDYPVYDAELVTRELNLAQLLGNDSLSSSINLTAEISGESFDPKTIKGKAKIIASPSRIRDINIDTLYTEANYRNENLLVDTLFARAQDVKISAGGNYNLSGPSDIRLSAAFGNLEAFRPYLPVDSFYTSGNLDAHLTGTMDSLTLNTTLDLDSTNYQQMTLEKFHLDAEGQIAGKDTIFDASLMANNFVTGEFHLDSISADAEGNLDSLYLNAGISNSEMSTDIQTGFVLGDVMKFYLDDWKINYKNQHWALQQPAVVKIDSTNYQFDNFRIASGESDTAQFVEIDGKITRQGEENFMLKVGNINLNQLAKTLEQDFEAEGIFDLNLNINGTAEMPVVEGKFNVDGTRVNEYSFTNFDGTLNFDNNELNFESLIVPEDSGKFEVSATIPMQLNLDTMGYVLDKNAPIDGHVAIDSFSLAILKTLDLAGDITGYLQGNIDIGGTIEEPDPKGSIRLENASVVVDQYGIDYNKIMLNLDFLKNSIKLDTLRINSDDGNLTGTGSIDFSSIFYKGEVSQSQIQLNFDQFNLVDHNQFNMQVSGNASLGGKKGNVVYDGDLKIPQAEIYLPAVMGMMGKMSQPEMPKPILVRHAERMEVSLDSLGIKTFEMPPTDSMRFDYFDSLEGQLRIRIPKNTWIKNEDMRIEIMGELELIKNKDFFEIFGSVEVVRGQYDLLGKTFVINEGTITFQGGEEMLPRLNIKATYTFRNVERAEQELSVQISGTAEEPEVEFLLDGSSISEGDALSYILFGKSMDALTMNEQQNVESAGGGSLAERAAASVISSQITDFLGERLNVDYIEVKSEGSFNNASVVVGKYLTNDLFVSYEQRFGEVDEKDLAKYEVKLEYELFRFLFFQLNNSSNDSGFDVIVKFDVK